jgi:ribosome-binding ATPase YchF (GTP1/OBG family)/dienelactone hydrolase
MDKLRKKLEKKDISLVAPDAPFVHPDDCNMRQWWNRTDNNTYGGLDASLRMLVDVWSRGNFIGIMGFSMGARMAHLMVLVQEDQQQQQQQQQQFPGLQFAIMVAGYDAPIPDNLPIIAPPSLLLLSTPTLHVWGQTDKLIASTVSQAVMTQYHTPKAHEHEGGHHVPMRAADVNAYLGFIDHALANNGSRPEQKFNDTRLDETSLNFPNELQSPSQLALALVVATKSFQRGILPDDESKMAQEDEFEALSAIFPDEVTLLSTKINDTFQFPISYRIELPSSKLGKWPPRPLSLLVSYPHTYPAESPPTIEWDHQNNVMEFGSGQMQALRMAVQLAAEAELGMPSVLSCVYAAREFFESGAMEHVATGGESLTTREDEEVIEDNDGPSMYAGVIKSATADRIHECNMQGLEIARQLLKPSTTNSSTSSSQADGTSKGGSWKYTIGLVGKPSAGKSTFFNAATAFARQRDDGDNILGGATMAPHPFTTIDPNIGYCLVPAPPGSCPEEDDSCPNVGCTHGRDHQGRRLIPVMLKDVAGLVPGAYQGRGRGNKFLSDLTDADVLIHVVDASGTADTEGNEVGVNDEDKGAGSHPLDDLAWIRNELIEWVYTNLMFKWDSIKRRGRGKLSDMFSGYKQSQAILWDVLYSVERYLDQTEHRDHALDHLEEWDEGDVRRLVSAFLGMRFPMALALNKADLPSAKCFIEDLRIALPIHGAHVGVPLSARNEMTFVRIHVDPTCTQTKESGSVPIGVWQCLQSALTLREPILVFPVIDMTTYAPLPGLTRTAMEDSSLPNGGMITCLQSSGGSAPTLWKDGTYEHPSSSSTEPCLLRDVLIMKPGSTVEDVFLSLKRLGALGGEFVRAEGASRINEKSKLVPKYEVIGKSNRILKIMTTKRSNWQTKV